MRFFFPVLLAGLFILTTLTGMAEAKPKHLFKIGSLAPEGSVWVLRFQQFAREVEEKTGGEVGFRVYTGGSMGDGRSSGTGDCASRAACNAAKARARTGA